jgi:hypothetical protein
VRIIFGDIFNIQKSKHHPVWMHGQEHPRSIYLKLILLDLLDNPKGNVLGVCPIQNVLSTLYKN